LLKVSLIISSPFFDLATDLMPTMPTLQTIINHFRCGKDGTGKWLLVAARNEKKMDPRILTLWGAVGHEKAAVLTAVKDWTSKRRLASEGLVVDEASHLRLFKASPEEAYGDNCKFISIGLVRPVDTVAETYLDSAREVPSTTGPRKRIKSAKGAQQQETGNSMIDGSVPSVQGANALSTR
jgi:hypothetical protein